MINTENFNTNIVLIGMPGCGKTTLGRIIADKLHVDFYDVDTYIEQTEEKTISELFSKGECHFRIIESIAVSHISRYHPCVISTGGGVVTVPANMDVLRKNSIIIFINTPINKIIDTLDIQKRPLLKNNINNLYSLYKERYELYKKYCDYEIINDCDLNTSVQNIIKLVIS